MNSNVILNAMKPVYKDTRLLDVRARKMYALTEDIMMENAAIALQKEIESYLTKNTKDINKVIILCGSGNNGADGYALARRMFSKEKFFAPQKYLEVTVCTVLEPKSQMCVLQKMRAQKTGVKIVNEKKLFSDNKEFFVNDISKIIFVDCIFGTGFHGDIPQKPAALIAKVNSIPSYRIACDLPTGIDLDGIVSQNAFIADTTITMGAQKFCMYTDEAKDFVGKVKTADLGIQHELFCPFKTEGDSLKPEFYLLEKSDCKFPIRKKQNVNKGSFGHTAVVGGTKTGAAVIASCASLKIGSGLATIVSNESEKDILIPAELMVSKEFPANTTAAAIGMGLGRSNPLTADYLKFLDEHKDISCVLDADIFYYKELKSFLKKQVKAKRTNIVLTPHPKEFVELIKNCLEEEYKAFNLEQLSVKEKIKLVVKNRHPLVKKFCSTYPGIVLLLKGANVLIGQKLSGKNAAVKIYVNASGTNALSKAGSGDILSGITVGLLAQNYSADDAVITASLWLAEVSKKFNSFEATPFALLGIETKN